MRPCRKHGVPGCSKKGGRRCVVLPSVCTAVDGAVAWVYGFLRPARTLMLHAKRLSLSFAQADLPVHDIPSRVAGRDELFILVPKEAGELPEAVA